MVGHHLQLVFQPLNLFPHPADLIVEFLAGDQIIGVHIHVFLPGLLQLGKLGVQFFFVVQVFVLCLINPLKFSDHITDHILLCFQKFSKILLQNFNQFFCIYRQSIGAVVCTTPVMPGTHPADISVFICADCTPEGPATFLAFDKGGEQIFIALAFLIHLKCFASGLHNLLCLFKNLRLNNTQIWTLHDHPLGFIFVCPLPGQKVGYFLFAVNNFTRIKFIRKNLSNPVLDPLAIPFCPQSSFV